VPQSLQAAAVFAFAIAPGYALLVGYQHQRSHTAPERDLHVFAQAFVLSAGWIALTWWPAGHLLTSWADRGELGAHEFDVWLLSCLMLGSAYVVGRSAGAAVRAIGKRKHGRLFSFMSVIGFFEQPSLWDRIWTEAHQRGNVLLAIRLKDGGSIEGLYASESEVDLSPRPRRVYLEKVYGYDEEGNTVVYSKGAYIEGDQIVGIEFKS
jgi:hypothetical protein